MKNNQFLKTVKEVLIHISLSGGFLVKCNTYTYRIVIGIRCIILYNNMRLSSDVPPHIYTHYALFQDALYHF
jgi:hypothetical protein